MTPLEYTAMVGSGIMLALALVVICMASIIKDFREEDAEYREDRFEGKGKH